MIMKKWITIVNNAEELFIGYTLLTIACVASIQVFMRYVFGIAYDWIDEASRYTTILITFVGAGICVKYGTHFSMDALIQYSPNRLKHLLKVLANLVSALTMAVVCYYSWIQIGKLHRFEATTPSLQIPMYIPYLPIGVFTLIITLRFIVQVAKHAKGLVTGEPFDTGKGGH